MRRAKPRRLRSNRRVERATAKTAFLAANASSGVHREAQRLCPMCSAGADLQEQGWQGAKHNISDVSNSAIVEYNCKEFVRSFMRRAEAGGMLAFRTVEHATGETVLSAANASGAV